MGARVSVRDVVEALELATDETSSYVHRSTGRVVTISHEDMRFAEDPEAERSSLRDWQQRGVDQALEVLDSDQWLPLPDRFEVHEWKIMDDFVRTLTDSDARDELADAIRGRGAFRHFKGTVRRLGIEDAWYAFRAATLDDIARDWLAENDFEPTPPGAADPAR